jgi:flavin-dependent dehydrogenase
MAAGATLLTNTRAEAIQVTSRGVTVKTPDGRLVAARACVLACGANYRFHRTLGLGRPDMFLQSAQLEMPFPPAEGIEVQFGRDAAPAGFAWLVPFTLGGEHRARVGLMTQSRAGDRFTTFLRSLYERSGHVSTDVPSPRRKMLPLGPISRTFGDRVVAVGDAAGLVKPTTGGGIYYGMLSGGFAAEVLDDGLRHDRLEQQTLRGYETKWRQRLGQEIKVGQAFRRLAETLSDESIDALIELGRQNGVVPILQRTASFNWHRKAALALLGHPSFRRIVFRSWIGVRGS